MTRVEMLSSGLPKSIPKSIVRRVGAIPAVRDPRIGYSGISAISLGDLGDLGVSLGVSAHGRSSKSLESRVSSLESFIYFAFALVDHRHRPPRGASSRDGFVSFGASFFGYRRRPIATTTTDSGDDDR